MMQLNKKDQIKKDVKNNLVKLSDFKDKKPSNEGDIPPERKPPEETCPVQPLGYAAGRYYFLDAQGQFRELSTSQLSKREELVALFGDCGAWLKENFPHWAKNKRTEQWEVVDFERKASSDWFNMRCTKEGLFGQHIKIRNTGVWRDDAGNPLLHCGDALIYKGKKRKAGMRIGNQIFASFPKISRPTKDCGPEAVFDIEKEISMLWNFKNKGSTKIVIGWLACAYFGASITWKPALFLIGSAGTGKSSLLRILRACLPAHLYTNDTTQAGLMQAMEGRAIPSIIDEAADNLKAGAAQKIMDMLLTTAGEEGTDSLRGSSEGKFKHFSINAPVAMGSISPPDMQEQHHGRFTLVELLPATKGNDFTQKHQDLRSRCEKIGSEIWARALSSFERYHQSKDIFRAQMAEEGSAGREMDQISALLSGWWILCQEGIPEKSSAARWISEIKDFLKEKDAESDQTEVASLRDRLVSSLIQCGRYTDKEAIGKLIQRSILKPTAQQEAENPDMFKEETARLSLEKIGIRVIAPYEQRSVTNGSKIPRPPNIKKSGGIWVWPKNVELQKLFKETQFSGQKLEYSLRRMPGAYLKKEPLKIGPFSKKNCIWLPLKTLQLTLDDEGEDDAPDINPF